MFTCTQIFRFLAEDSVLMKQFSCQMKTNMYYSDDFSVDQSVQTNFDPFSLAPLQNYIQAAPVVQLFSHFCIIMFFEPFFLWLCVEWEPLLMLDHTEMLDASAQQGVVVESGPERMH